MYSLEPSKNAKAGTFKDYLGQKISYWSWVPKKIVGYIQLQHGFSEHGSYYFDFAEELYKQGYKVAIMDLPGHGRSEGARGHIRSMRVYVHVVDRFFEMMKEKKVPNFIIGHSMGGLISLLFKLLKKPKELTGMVLMSPLLGMNLPLKPLLYLYGKFLLLKDPDRLYPKGLSPKDLTRNKDNWDIYRQDRYRLHTISPNLFLTMIKYTDLIQKFAKKVHLPVVFFHGLEDRVVSPNATMDFFNHIKSKDKQLFVYKDAKHELLLEYECDQVKGEIYQWLKSHLK